MMEAVHHYEGTVNQVMGDGIMALFGAPLVHEDHAVWPLSQGRAKMAPPPFESPHAPAGSRSSALDEREYKADRTSRDPPHCHRSAVNATALNFRGRNRVAT
jgi:class 3 adenylate cyclase